MNNPGNSKTGPNAKEAVTKDTVIQVDPRLLVRNSDQQETLEANTALRATAHPSNANREEKERLYRLLKQVQQKENFQWQTGEQYISEKADSITSAVKKLAIAVKYFAEINYSGNTHPVTRGTALYITDASDGIYPETCFVETVTWAELTPSGSLVLTTQVDSKANPSYLKLIDPYTNREQVIRVPNPDDELGKAAFQKLLEDVRNKNQAIAAVANQRSWTDQIRSITDKPTRVELQPIKQPGGIVVEFIPQTLGMNIRVSGDAALIYAMKLPDDARTVKGINPKQRGVFERHITRTNAIFSTNSIPFIVADRILLNSGMGKLVFVDLDDMVQMAQLY